MRLFYDLTIRILSALLRFPALFSPKLKSFFSGRKYQFEKIRAWRRTVNDPVIWIHCASLGEYEMIRPLLDDKRFTDGHTLMVTFFSPSGFEVVSERDDNLQVFYLPLDSEHNANEFVEIVKPAEVYFVKNEFWFNYLKTLMKKGIPTYLLNGKFHKGQMFFQRYGKWFRKHLEAFTHIFVQDKGSRKLLMPYYPKEKITLAGDLRYDRVAAIRNDETELPEIEKFNTGDYLIVGGSTWEDEEKILSEFLEKNPKYDAILAPHDISERHIEKIEHLMRPFGVEKYSTWDKTNNDFRILIVDSIGMLSKIYRYADIAFVGGGFGTGLHNILEPATYGVPVIYGPKTEKFPEAARFVEEGIGYQIYDTKSFFQAVDDALNGPDKDEIIAIMDRLRGAVDKTLKVLR